MHEVRRVLFVIDSLGKIGGAERMFIDQANYFARKGIEVHFATVVAHKDPGAFDAELNIGRDVRHYRFTSLVMIREHLRLRSYMRKHGIIVVYSYLDFSNTVARIHKMLFNPFIRVIIVEPGDPRRKTPRMRLFDRVANFFVYKVFAMGGAVRDNLLEYLPVHRTKILSMRNGVYEMASKSEVAMRLQHGFSDPVRLLHVGNMATENKGHAALIDMMEILVAEHPGIRAHLTFIGDGHLRPSLEMRAAASGVERRISFAGSQRRDAVKKAYGEADIFVFNSKTEGGAASIMEATSAGLPVVSSDFQGVGQVVDDQVTGYIVPRDGTREFAEKIAYLATHAGTARSMGEKARQMYEARFAYEPAAETFIREIF